MNDWVVIFFDGAPVWQYGDLIKALPTPQGSVLPALACNAVSLAANAFVELRVAEEGTAPEQILFVRQEHVMCAFRRGAGTQLGFAPNSRSYMQATTPDHGPASGSSADAPQHRAGG